jgi:hypothetical protein
MFINKMASEHYFFPPEKNNKRKLKTISKTIAKTLLPKNGIQ